MKMKYQELCSVEDFAVYFLNLIKNQTEEFTRGNSSACNTPRKITTTGLCDNVTGAGTAAAAARKVNLMTTTVQTPLTTRHDDESKINNKNSMIIKVDRGPVNRSLFPVESCRNNLSPSLQHTSITTTIDINDGTVGDKRAMIENIDRSDELLDSQKSNNSLGLITIDTCFSDCNSSEESHYDNSGRSSIDHHSSIPGVKQINQKKTYNKIDTSRKTTDIRTSTPIRNGFSTSNNNSLNGSTRNRYINPSVSASLSTGSGNTLHQSNDKNFSGKKNPNRTICLGDYLKTPERNEFFSISSDFPQLGSRTKKNKTSPNLHTRTLSADNAKPKRRVVPLTVSQVIPNEFLNSPFRSDNNLVSLMKEEQELDDRGLTNERVLLRTQKDVISKDFLEQRNPTIGLHAMLKEKLKPTIVDSLSSHHPSSSTLIGSPSTSSSSSATKKMTRKIIIDLAAVTNEKMLNIFIDVYSMIIDLNLTINVLSEIAYLLNLLNADFEAVISTAILPESVGGSIMTSATKGNNEIMEIYQSTPHNILKTINNCVYFAFGVLNKQKHILALFDVTTIKVLLDNERLIKLHESMKQFLVTVHAHKSKLETQKSINDSSFKIVNNQNSVFYQQENDTRDNFPTDKEFAAFKKQRDAFYSIFRIWESKHLNSTWVFAAELGPKVKYLLNLMQHPINMAHLAKLITAQLIISCNHEDSASELQLALPNADLSKLSKLTQRLIAPSYYSAELLFPGVQIFFKEFILAAEQNNVFMEQLKISLINELLEINNSSYDVLNLSNSESPVDEFNEYVMRPETMSTMRVLAKFIGFIVALPFQYESFGNAVIDIRQIKMRNNLLPQFDVKQPLMQAISENKLVITIPWFVQYLTMLDHVTLRLDYYTEILNILYDLYMNLSVYIVSKLSMAPSSIFILRTCLGWLFDQPNIPDNYYKYRKNQNYDNNNSIGNLSKEIKDKLKDKPIVRKSFNTDEAIILKAMDPILEQILIVACPFMADFRLSIMPTMKIKTLSRTGRYRHITTKVSDNNITLSRKNQPQQNNQDKLIEAFLHSQTLSLRKIVEFVTERVTSTVIKNFQVLYFLEIKRQAQDRVKLIEKTDKKTVIEKLRNIYTKAQIDLDNAWKGNIHKMIEEHVKKVMEGLLPIETIESVKITCINLAIQKCMTKANEWKNMHFNEIDIFTKDITIEAAKVIKNSALREQPISATLGIDVNRILPSQVLEQLQQIIHIASMRPADLNLEEILLYLTDYKECLDTQKLLPTNNRMAGYMILQLGLLIICNRDELLTNDLLKILIKCWLHESLLPFSTPPSQLDDDLNDIDSFEAKVKLDKKLLLPDKYIFANLMSNHFVQQLRDKPKRTFESLSKFLFALIDNNLITLNLLNQQIVALFSYEWPESTLKMLSFLTGTISEKYQEMEKNIDDVESHLFMEMLSDLARGMEDF